MMKNWLTPSRNPHHFFNKFNLKEKIFFSKKLKFEKALRDFTKNPQSLKIVTGRFFS